MKVKSFVALMLALMLCMPGLVGATAERAAGYQLGDKIEDFSFTGYDGTEYTLYGLLEEKQMVLLNFWATWCGPCRNEFPMMDAAYRLFQDDVAVVALSTEAEDTDEVLAKFAEDNGMSFIVGRDETNLYGTGFYTGYVPTTVVVDRFGTICYYEYGSVTAAGAFERLFAAFVGDGYTQSVLLEDGIPNKLPDVEPADPADLLIAIGSEGLTFLNPTDDAYNWPVRIVSEGGRSYVMTTNQAQDSSVSSVDVRLNAAAGDVLALDYKVSSETNFDFLVVRVNGEVVKRLSGERDWSAYAYTFTAEGDYTVTLAYVKDEVSDAGDDGACFDNVRLLSGDEAAAALAALPVYPTSEATTLTVVNEDARRIIIDDQSGNMASWFAPDAVYYIVPGEAANFVATLAEGNDPDVALAVSYYGGAPSVRVLADCVAGDAYAFSGGIDSMETTGTPYCYASVIAGGEAALVVYFNSEQNLNAFWNRYLSDGRGGYLATWAYADDSEPVATEEAATPVPPAPLGMSNYSLRYVDQNGDPVEGLIANICDDSACTPMFTDAGGEIFFQYPSFMYHIQVIRVPEGYEYDLTEESYLDTDGGSYTFVVTKN